MSDSESRSPQITQVPLSQLAKVRVVAAPMGIKSEAAVPNAWIYVDVQGVDIGTFVRNAKATVAAALDSGELNLPPGYTINWSGQFEYLERANQRLLVIIPVTLLLVALLIYLSTGSLIKTAIVFLAVPFSLVGAFWMLHVLDYNMSVAVWVGLIALAGLDAETGMVMLLYLDIAHDDAKREGRMRNADDLHEAIYHGAVRRVRPKIMTAATTFIALVPILWSTGTGADVMKRIAAPMVGGVFTSVLMELLVYPAIFYIWRRRSLPPAEQNALQ
jgi:Cu(I)/Ag(I) efflux system membrane protein CusA/SilA